MTIETKSECLKTTAEFLGYQHLLYTDPETSAIESYKYKLDNIDFEEVKPEELDAKLIYWAEFFAFDNEIFNPLSPWNPDSDWNQLMKVVEAIENTYTNSGFRPRVTISTNFCRVDKIENKYEDDSTREKLNGVLLTCYEFIKQVEEWKKN